MQVVYASGQTYVRKVFTGNRIFLNEGDQLPAGMYIIKVMDNKRSAQTKVVVE
jgi:hypothetical protein